MIFLCGIPSEPSLGLVIERLEAIGAPHVVFHQRQFAEAAVELDIAQGRVRGHLGVDGHSFRLEDFSAIYTRLMDYRLLPEVEREPAGSPVRETCERLHAKLMLWHELAPGRVLNRTAEISPCYSKPLQLQLICRAGFAIPETLVTNDPDEVRAFRRRVGRVVYKSASWVRSIVTLLDDDEEDRLDAVRACPVLFQQYVEGVSLRVHTVGRRVFATSVRSVAVDYRYGEDETVEPFDLDSSLAERCLGLAAAFGLEFAGIDLELGADGEAYCLEINPAPAFSYYELHTGQPIARAVADHLLAGAA